MSMIDNTRKAMMEAMKAKDKPRKEALSALLSVRASVPAHCASPVVSSPRLPILEATL